MKFKFFAALLVYLPIYTVSYYYKTRVAQELNLKFQLSKLIAYKSIAEHNPDVMNMSFETFDTKKGFAYNISTGLKCNLTKITVTT